MPFAHFGNEKRITSCNHQHDLTSDSCLSTHLMQFQSPDKGISKQIFYTANTLTLCSNKIISSKATLLAASHSWLEFNVMFNVMDFGIDKNEIGLNISNLLPVIFWTFFPCLKFVFDSIVVVLLYNYYGWLYFVHFWYS